MAALMDGFALACLPTKSHLLSMELIPPTNNVIVSFVNGFIHVYNIDDQKLVQSWSICHGVNVTCSAIWCHEDNNYICVLDKQEIRHWRKDEKNLDKAKKKHIKTDICNIFTVEDYQPIVLCENGAVDFVYNIKLTSEIPIIEPADKIVYSHLVPMENGICVVYVVQSVNKKNLHCQYFTKDSSQWEHKVFSVNYEKSVATYCCHTDESCNTYIFILGLEKDLYRIKIDKNISNVKEEFVTLIHELGASVRMLCLNSTQMVIAGLQRNNEDGIGIFDLKYSAVQSFKPFPECCTNNLQLLCVNKHILLSCGKNIYAFPYELKPSTIAEFIGKSLNAEDMNSSSLHVINWCSDSKITLSNKAKQLENVINKLIDSSKTPSQNRFTEEFNKFVNYIQGCNASSMLSHQMVQLCQRFLSEKKFWPREELKQLLIHGFVPSGLSSELLNLLVEKEEKELLHLSLHQLSEIPESSIIHVLQYYLSQTDDEFNKTILLKSATVIDVDTEKCPFGKMKAHFICGILSLPFSDIFLMNQLRQLKFQFVLILLEFLFYLMATNDHQTFSFTTQPKLQTIVDWISCILDVHVTQLILSPDARVLLIKLHEAVTQQTQFFNGINELEAVLSQFKSKLRNPVKPNIGQYCIEVLHVY